MDRLRRGAGGCRLHQGWTSRRSGEPCMTEFSAYMLSTVLEGEFILYRGRGDGLPPILLVAAAGAYPSPSSLQRLEHQFALRADLDATWAARPIELIRRDARPMLVLED